MASYTGAQIAFDGPENIGEMFTADSIVVAFLFTRNRQTSKAIVIELAGLVLVDPRGTSRSIWQVLHWTLLELKLSTDKNCGGADRSRTGA